MWFRRKNWRNTWFHTDADVRGGLLGSFFKFKTPYSFLEKQQEIVNEYHTIQNRINLNNQLIAKLEETAQTIYKQWFVEFEFPNFPPLEGVKDGVVGYKSSGGKMVWCEELEKEIGGVESWENFSVINIKDGTHDSPKSSRNRFSFGYINAFKSL
jgi:type I restriction enzyme S subunit